MAEWIGRRIKRAHAFKFCGLGADVPLHKRVQTVEDLDADNVDGDPGPWECEKNSLLLGPTTAQRNVSMQAQRALGTMLTVLCALPRCGRCSAWRQRRRAPLSSKPGLLMGERLTQQLRQVMAQQARPMVCS